MEEREKLKSRLGFILLSAGCAIGIGNVWKFPYTAGQGGGGAFVLFYLLFLIILGLPIMTMEFAVGRASQKSPVKAYQALEKPGQKWHIHGIITLIGCYLLMMFYTTVTGWMLHYFYMTVTGQFQGLDADGVSGQFTTMLRKPLTMGFLRRRICLLPWTAERSGKSNKGHDDFFAYHHDHSGGQQLFYGWCKRRPCLLSDPGL